MLLHEGKLKALGGDDLLPCTDINLDIFRCRSEPPTPWAERKSGGRGPY